LAHLDSLTQSIFIDMFGDPKFNGKGWPIKTLKELGKVTTGGTPPSSMEGMFGGAIPFVTPGDLESGEPVRRTVTEDGALQAGTVRAGATFVCCIGATIGKMDKALVRSSFNQQLNAVEWSHQLILDDFGLELLRFFKPTIVAWGASTTLPILKKSSFEKIEVPVPPLGTQQQFSAVLGSIELMRRNHKRQLVEADALFNSLQSLAFTGGA
jgi:type I restriction enzyme S subunit